MDYRDQTAEAKTTGFYESRARIVTVSPIMGGAAVSGPAGALLAAQGFAVSIAGVADFYRDFLDVLVVDLRDSQAAEELRKAGLRVHCASAIMQTMEDRVALPKAVLAAAMQPPATVAAAERA
jgi:LPPG:FO 2-phospho-L-lactate transferase